MGGAVYTITFNTAATTANVQQVLRAIGIDSSSSADPGAGLRTVNFEVIDGGTAGMDLLNVLAGCDHLMICDAARTGAPPASLVKLAAA